MYWLVSRSRHGKSNSENLFRAQSETDLEVASWGIVQSDIAACVALDFDIKSKEPALPSERCSRCATGGGNFTATLLLGSLSFSSAASGILGGKNLDWSLP